MQRRLKGYRWKTRGKHYPFTAEEAFEALRAIKEKYGNRYKPEHVVVEVRRDPSHIFNPVLEWDDAVAGDKWRVQQVRLITQTIEVEYEVVREDAEPQTMTMRAFECVSETSVGDDENNYYYETETILGDEALRQRFMKKLLAQIGALQKKWRMYNEFEPLSRALDEVRERIKKEDPETKDDKA